MISSGGFAAPTPTYAYPGVTMAQAARGLRFALPRFSALRGGIDFRPPHVRWAHQRERELRAATKMWDWPRPPA